MSVSNLLIASIGMKISTGPVFRFDLWNFEGFSLSRKEPCIVNFLASLNSIRTIAIAPLLFIFRHSGDDPSGYLVGKRLSDTRKFMVLQMSLLLFLYKNHLFSLKTSLLSNT